MYLYALQEIFRMRKNDALHNFMTELKNKKARSRNVAGFFKKGESLTAGTHPFGNRLLFGPDILRPAAEFLFVHN